MPRYPYEVLRGLDCVVETTQEVERTLLTTLLDPCCWMTQGIDIQ